MHFPAPRNIAAPPLPQRAYVCSLLRAEGRSQTDVQMRAEILTYSRSRGQSFAAYSCRGFEDPRRTRMPGPTALSQPGERQRVRPRPDMARPGSCAGERPASGPRKRPPPRWNQSHDASSPSISGPSCSAETGTSGGGRSPGSPGDGAAAPSTHSRRRSSPLLLPPHDVPVAVHHFGRIRLLLGEDTRRAGPAHRRRFRVVQARLPEHRQRAVAGEEQGVALPEGESRTMTSTCTRAWFQAPCRGCGLDRQSPAIYQEARRGARRDELVVVERERGSICHASSSSDWPQELDHVSSVNIR